MDSAQQAVTQLDYTHHQEQRTVMETEAKAQTRPIRTSVRQVLLVKVQSHLPRCTSCHVQQARAELANLATPRSIQMFVQEQLAVRQPVETKQLAYIPHQEVLQRQEMEQKAQVPQEQL